MAKLNQIIAIEKGVKTKAKRVETDMYHDLEKAALFAGLTKTYTPIDEDGERLPSERVDVRIKSSDMNDELTKTLTRLIDVTATKDAANTRAKADIKVGDTVIAADVPVTTLMFLEKEIEDLATFVGKLPVLDPTQTWTYDPNRGLHVSAPVQTTRSKKMPRSFVAYEATEHHPAQVTMYHEDVLAGTWETIKFSGAMAADDVKTIKERIEDLRQAIKFAREEANNIDVEDVKYGESILTYVFGGVTT